MTEDEAREWVRSRPYVSPAAYLRIERVIDLIVDEAGRQNLIAPSTIESIWHRHVVDSLQLVPLAGDLDSVVDIGTGAGFPGAIFAALDGAFVTCIEPRTRRADFLHTIFTEIGSPSIVLAAGTRSAKTDAPFHVVTARAVAPPSDLFAMADHLADAMTRWVLPAGRTATASLDEVRREWHGTFHVEQSLTASDAGIIVATNVRSRGAK